MQAVVLSACIVGLGTPSTARTADDVRPVPRDAERLGLDGAPALGTGSQGRVFVNFAGAELTHGPDDAADNITQIEELAGEFSPYGGDAAVREAILQAVQADYAAYNMVVTDSRPSTAAYVMVLVGPDNPIGGGVLGIAPVDCNDNQTHANIAFAFHGDGDGRTVGATATTISHEVAHTFGLEHTVHPESIMNADNIGEDPMFLAECLALTGAMTECPAQHAEHCQDGQQDAHEELLALFGPAQVDGDSDSDDAADNSSDDASDGPPPPFLPPIERGSDDDGACACSARRPHTPYPWMLSSILLLAVRPRSPRGPHRWRSR